MKCKHEHLKKEKDYGDTTCLSCGTSCDISDVNMLNENGTVKNKAQKQWDKEREKESKKLST